MYDRIRISTDGTYFVKDNKPFFMLADTAWFAFSCTTEKEWEDYLDIRKAQNFNCLQISILPIMHDRTIQKMIQQPFLTDKNGNWITSELNTKYFERAAGLLKIARDKGFEVCLAVLWGSFVPGNWMSDLDTSTIMTKAEVENYVSYISKLFKPCSPVYYISGDTDFREASAAEYYGLAIESLKKYDSEAVISMHLCGGVSRIPENLASKLDFYTFQSGHSYEKRRDAFTLAQEFYHKEAKKPIMNSEPCYEGHGRLSCKGRHTSADVRYALWNSILGGAKAGFTYGAHGVWCWHRKNCKFMREEKSCTPYDFGTAINLNGAWDAGFAKWICENYYLEKNLTSFGTSESNDEFPLAFGENIFALYMPYTSNVTVGFDLSNFNLFGFDLESKRVFCPTFTGREIQMPNVESDILIIGTRK